jgi:hypothetical protein
MQCAGIGEHAGKKAQKVPLRKKPALGRLQDTLLVLLGG